MADAEFFERLFEGDAGGVVVEVREATMATEGDEVVVAFGLIALEAARH